MLGCAGFSVADAPKEYKYKVVDGYTLVDLPASDEKVTLTMMGSEGGPSETDNVNDALDQFSKLYPNIAVEYTPGPYDDHHSKLLTMVAAGNCADVFYCGSAFYDEFAKRGVLYDITGLYGQVYSLDDSIHGHIANGEGILIAVLLAGLAADQLEAIAQVFPQDADGFVRDERTGYQTKPEEVTDPFGILDVILPTFDSSNPLGVGDGNADVVLQDVERKKKEQSDGAADALGNGQKEAPGAQPDGSGKAGRSTMDDAERTSDPVRSLTGQPPKPSRPEGSAL